MKALLVFLTVFAVYYATLGPRTSHFELTIQGYALAHGQISGYAL